MSSEDPLALRDEFSEPFERLDKWLGLRSNNPASAISQYDMSQEFPLLLIQVASLSFDQRGLEDYLAEKESLPVICDGRRGQFNVNLEGPYWVSRVEQGRQDPAPGVEFTAAYTQLFRTGCVEFAVSLRGHHEDGEHWLSADWFDRREANMRQDLNVRRIINDFLEVQDSLGLEFPRFLTVTIYVPKTKELRLHCGESSSVKTCLDRKEAYFPVLCIRSKGAVGEVLDEMEELVWNAFNAVHPRQRLRAGKAGG